MRHAAFGIWFIGMLLSSCRNQRPAVELDSRVRLLRDDLPVAGKRQGALTAHAASRGPTALPRDFSPKPGVLRSSAAGLLSDAPPLMTLESELVHLTLDPASRSLQGSAEITLRATEEVSGEVRFSLSASAGVNVVANSPDAGFTHHEGVLTVTPNAPIVSEERWHLTIEWSDVDVEQEIDLFPEGGGSVLANLISADSTFFTFGYDFWPRLQGPDRFHDIDFEVTYPADQTLVMSGERQQSNDNQDGTRTDTWRIVHPTQGVVGLALASYESVSGHCGEADLEIYALPGKSDAGYPITPATYVEVIEELCSDFVSRFGEPVFGTIRWVGVDERFRNGYSTPGLVLVPNFTWDDDGEGSFLQRDFYLAHELSHQWWGNDVLIGSASELWLLEGMADYAAGSSIERIRGPEAGRWIWLWEVRALLDYLSGGGRDHPLVPDAASEMEPRIYYIKGAWVLRMLETVIGETVMVELLRDFRLQHSLQVTTTDEFVAAAERHADRDLDWFFEQWLRGTGVLSLDASGRELDAAVEVTVTQRSTWSENAAHTFRTPLTIRAHRGERVAEETFELEEPQATFLLKWP